MHSLVPHDNHDSNGPGYGNDRNNVNDMLTNVSYSNRVVLRHRQNRNLNGQMNHSKERGQASQNYGIGMDYQYGSNRKNNFAGSI